MNSEKMKSKKQLSKKISQPEFSYFGLQAYWGITKHMGSLEATKELMELCHIGGGEYILDVGCGTGKTPCYLTKNYGCRVIGVDNSERMIERSRERAKRENAGDGVNFILADAHNLPFKEDTFDRVIGESVTAFLKDKEKGLREYRRVTKPGGYIGLNDCTWIKTNPPEKLTEYLSLISGAELGNPDGWKKLLEGSGLREIEMRTHRINAMRQWIDEVRWYGLKDLLQGWLKFFTLYTKNSDFRKYTKEMRPPFKTLKNIFEYMGYGIYAGRK